MVFSIKQGVSLLPSLIWQVQLDLDVVRAHPVPSSLNIPSLFDSSLLGESPHW